MTSKQSRKSVLDIPSPCSSQVVRGVRYSEGRRLLGGRYEMVVEEKLGQGAQSVVEMGIDTVTGERVAVKKLKNHREVEYPVADYFREVWLLKALPVHECVVELKDVLSEKEEVCLVFEACECDLRQFIKTQGPLERTEYRMASLHLWAGMDHLHTRGIAHRDLKPCNILIKEGYLKIADLGLAKYVLEKTVLGGECPMTREVASLWYRAPEVCLGVVGVVEGAKMRGTEMDIWALGCVLYEMGTGKALLAAEAETGLLMKIFSTFGTPDYAKLPKYCANWPRWKEDNANSRRTYTELRARPIDAAIVELIFKCLKVDPRLRITTKEALAHEIYNF